MKDANQTGKQRTLLFIGAHPDDETFGVGGTLVKYASAGVKVFYVCGTRGELGSANPEDTREGSDFGDVRWAELQCAAEIIGLSDVIYLGYRDSGMPGSPDNKHPKALAAAPVEEVTGRIVRIIRDLKPEVVITFDPIGGYRHPDHIAIHNAAVKAFQAAADPEQFPEAGPAFRPQKLYFTIFPRRLLKLAVKVLPLFGRDPRRFGRNNDVDLTSLVETEFPVQAAVSFTKEDAEKRNRATLCYVSQQDGGPPRRGIMGIVFKLFGLFGNRDLYMRAYPPPGGRKESDLFEGVS